MSSPPPLRVGVLSLQGDAREHLLMLSRLGADTRPVRLPEELDDVDALVLPGGESTTIGHLVRSAGLEGPLRRRLQSGMPSLATCAGVILLARVIADGRADQLALGALDVTVRRNAYGRQRQSFEAEVSVPALGSEPFTGVFIRAPLLESVGSGVEILARLGGVPVAVADGARVGLTFHPEMTSDTRFHELFLERARDLHLAARRAIKVV